MIWRWLAVMLALPTLVLILSLPMAWPVWLGVWGALVIKGFGGRARTRLRSRTKSCR